MGTCKRCGRELKDPNAVYGWRCAEILGIKEEYGGLSGSVRDVLIHSAHQTEDTLQNMGIEIKGEEDDKGLFLSLLLENMNKPAFETLSRDPEAMRAMIVKLAGEDVIDRKIAAQDYSFIMDTDQYKQNPGVFFRVFTEWNDWKQPLDGLPEALENLTYLLDHPFTQGEKYMTHEKPILAIELGLWLTMNLTPEKLEQHKYARIRDLREVYDKMYYLLVRAREGAFMKIGLPGGGIAELIHQTRFMKDGPQGDTSAYDLLIQRKDAGEYPAMVYLEEFGDMSNGWVLPYDGYVKYILSNQYAGVTGEDNMRAIGKTEAHTSTGKTKWERAYRIADDLLTNGTVISLQKNWVEFRGKKLVRELDTGELEIYSEGENDQLIYVRTLPTGTWEEKSGNYFFNEGQ